MEYRIEDLPSSERPRERLEQHGPGPLSTAELLALILRTGVSGKNVKQLCNELLEEMGMERLQNANLEELEQFRGMGRVKAGQLMAAFELAGRLDAEEVRYVEGLDGAEALFRPRLDGCEQEELHAAFLGSSNRVKSVEQMFKGSLRSIDVNPRDIVREALRHNAAAVIIGHNHPDGDSTPTQADIDTTHRIRDALSSFTIKLLDHLVVGEDGCYSFAQEGMLGQDS